MNDPIAVFLGPTLPREEARALLDAHYLPPAEQGHLVEAVLSLRPGTIVLIDGAFGSVPTVRHKEILWALSQGIEIFGAGSLGALRAVELAGFGMRGHGLIYRWYRATPLAEDDEVAVAMMPPELGGAAVGDALIDMRVTFKRAARAGIISKDLRDRLVRIARTMHFLERSYEHVLAVARDQAAVERPVLDRLDKWLPDHAISQKRTDAASLLRWIREQSGMRRSQPLGAPSSFQMTEAFARDLEETGLDVSCLMEQKR